VIEHLERAEAVADMVGDQVHRHVFPIPRLNTRRCEERSDGPVIFLVM
jgi:hypothetical protein